MKLDLKEVKIIGVLGGYGPYATNDFFNLILKKTKAKKDWEHMHVIIDSNPRIPSRVRAFLYDEESPIKYMLEGVNRLKKAGADFFICPCNTAHYFLNMEEELPLPFINMIDVTIDRIIEKGITKVGVIGSEVTIMTNLYKEALLLKNIEVVNVEDLTVVREIIEAAKQNKGLKEAEIKLLNIINNFKDNGVESVIYACTELPIVLDTEKSPLFVFDSSSILAEEAIKYANK